MSFDKVYDWLSLSKIRKWIFISSIVDIMGAGNKTQTYRKLCLLRLGKLKKSQKKKSSWDIRVE